MCLLDVTAEVISCVGADAQTTALSKLKAEMLHLATIRSNNLVHLTSKSTQLNSKCVFNFALLLSTSQL